MQCDGSHWDESMHLEYYEEKKKSCFSDSKGTFISIMVSFSDIKMFLNFFKKKNVSYIIAIRMISISK